METTIKTTPLNQWHKSHGANMANFGGFEMPLWYDTGVKAEHLAVVQSAGIFDTSHMASVLVTGHQAFELLQYCHTRDLSSLVDGRCVYGAILNDQGHVIDDAIVYRFQADHYMVCVNAGMGAAVADHLASQLPVIQKKADNTDTTPAGQLLMPPHIPQAPHRLPLFFPPSHFLLYKINRIDKNIVLNLFFPQFIYLNQQKTHSLFSIACPEFKTD